MLLYISPYNLFNTYSMNTYVYYISFEHRIDVTIIIKLSCGATSRRQGQQIEPGLHWFKP